MKPYKLWIATGLMGIGVFVTQSFAQNPYAKWKFDDINFNPPVPERFVLSNGLTVYFLPDAQLPVVTMSALVRIGEAFVPLGQAGLGGIAGEALTTGGTTTRTPDQVDEQLEYLGIQWDGSIGMESAEFSMQCLSKDYATAIELLSDLLINPGFEQSRVELAVANALEDLRRQNDSPGRIIRREFSHAVYGDHPYGRTPSEKSLSGITRPDVESFYRAYVHPNTTILAVSGDLEPAAVKSSLEKSFAGWKQGDAPHTSIPDVPSPMPGVYQIEKDISQTNLRFGHLGIDRRNPDRHAIRIMNHILGGGGFTSRMVGKVRSDSGWAYSVGTSFTTSEKPGLFLASCQTKTETTTKALSLMQWVIEDLRNNGIREAELTTAKESVLNSDVFNYDTPVEVVESYAWQEYYGFPADQMKLDMLAIRNVTKADVDAVAKKYLDPSKYVIVAVGKIAEFDAPLTKFGSVQSISLEETP